MPNTVLKHWIQCVAALLVAFLLAGCAGQDAAENVEVRTQAASAAHNRVLGFEAPSTDWASSNGSAITSSSSVTQGSASLSITPNGYTELYSVQVPAPGAARATATLDIKLPQTLGWGDVRLIVRVPSQNQWWRDLGSQPLAGRAAGTFHTLSFAIPSDLQAALNSNATDVDYRIVLNVPWGSGTYVLDNLVVSDQVTGGTPSPTSNAVELRVAVPRGATIPEVMISGLQQVTIDDRSTLSKPGALSKVTNLGTSQLEFGAGVQTYAGVTSVGSVSFLRSQSHIFGRLETAGTVLQQDNVLVDGGIATGVPIEPVVTSWSVNWPANATTDISRAPDAANYDIAPGAYDAIQVYSRATVTLRSGAYFINSLVLEPQVHFRVDASSGPVLIYVKDLLRLNVGIEYIGGKAGDVLFGYVGQQTALFEEAIVATVVAPNSDIELRRPASGLPHQGSFFGKHVHVFSDATVLHIPLTWDFLCSSGDKDKDGVFDCFEVCTSNASKSFPGTCGCGTPDTDTDGDHVPDCKDACPNDPKKVRMGTCGCADHPAPAGTACADGNTCSASVCNGAGTCGTEQDGAPLPTGCVAREFEGSLYWACSTPLSWTAAQAACAAQPGRSLVRIESQLENAYLAWLAPAQSWLGANDQSVEGTFRWAVGTSVDGDAFLADGKRVKGAFNAFGADGTGDASKDCVYLGDAQWHGEACTQTHGFVCESHASDGCVTFEPETTCSQFFPGRDCKRGLPGPDDGGACDDTLDSTTWAQFQADVEACWTGCTDADPAKRADCVNACQNSVQVPPQGSKCLEDPDDGHELSCEPKSWTTRTCKDASECNANEACMMKPKPNCYVCDEKDSEGRCIKDCRGTLYCAVPSDNCDSPANPELCLQVSLCPLHEEPESFSDPNLGDGADLTPEKYDPGGDFPEPDLDADPGDYPSDPACASGTCTKQGTTHPWCKVDVVADAKKADPDANTMGDRNVDEKKAGRSGNSDDLVSFDFDPNVTLDYHATPGPFGSLSNFDVDAGASFLARSEFHMLGAAAKLDLLDAQVLLEADRCGVSTENSWLKVMGKDFLPDLIEEAGFEEGDVKFSVPNAEARKACADTFAEFEKAVNRAKKALRDVQDLIAQYKAIIEQNKAAATDPNIAIRRFADDFCKKIVADPPRGFPTWLKCENNPKPEQVINAFIEYYEKYALDGLKQALRDMVGKSFGEPGRIPLFDLQERMSERIVRTQFAVGPIPCVLEIEVFVTYGIGGELIYEFNPAGLLSLDNGEQRLVWVKAQAVPSAGAGITLFVGAGGGVPGFEASVGVYGEVNLATLNLPMWAGAGIKVRAEDDPRPPPDDRPVLFPPGGPKQYVFAADYEVGAEANITNILAANLGVRIKIEFLFFSMKWQRALLTLPGFNAPPIPLLHGEGGAKQSVGVPDWAVIRMPVIFPDLEDLVPGTMPAAGTGVENVNYSASNTEELFFDSLCQCIEDGKECYRHDDCCNSEKEGGNFICWSDPQTPVPASGVKTKTCSDCRDAALHESCNTAKDCCGGEENNICTDDEYQDGWLPCTVPPNSPPGTFCVQAPKMVKPTTTICHPKSTIPDDPK